MRYAEAIVYEDSIIRELSRFELDFYDYLYRFGGWFIILLLLAFMIRYMARKQKAVESEIDDAVLSTPTAGIADRAWMVAALLFILGMIIRVSGLAFESIDAQEYTYYTKAIRSDSLLFTILNPFMISPHLPLNRVVLFFWDKLFDTFIMARLPAAIFGAATAPILYLWIRRDYSRFAAILASGLLVISPFHVYFSQCVSPYTLLTLLVVSSCALHSRALAPEASGRTRIAYATVNALGFVCHFGFWFVYLALAMETLYKFMRSPKAILDRLRLWRFGSLLSYALIPLAAYSILFFHFLSRLDVIKAMMTKLKIHYQYPDLTDGLINYLVEMTKFFAHGHIASFGSLTAAWLGAIALPFMAYGIYSRIRKSREHLWYLLWPVVILAFFMFVNGLFTMLKLRFFDFALRRLVSNIPLMYALFAVGLWLFHERLAQKSRRWAYVVTASVILLVGGGQIRDLVHIKTVRQKADLAAAVDYIEENLQDGDGIAIGPYIFYEGIFNYYFLRPKTERWYSEMAPARWQRSRAPAPATDCTADQVADSPDECGIIEPPHIFLALTDMYIPWDTALEQVDLRRVWLLKIIEKPYEFPELLGEGTTTAENFSSHGFQSCGIKKFTKAVVSCFEQPLPRPNADFLYIGRNDYRQLTGFIPNAYVRAPSRRITDDSKITFADPGNASQLRLKLGELEKFPAADLVLEIRAGDILHTEKIAAKEGIREYELDLSSLNNSPADRFTVYFNLVAHSPEDREVYIDYGAGRTPQPRAVSGYLLYEAEIMRSE
jgi:hypothetical protein